MSKQTKVNSAINYRVAKILLTAALILTTLTPLVVNAASDQSQAVQDSTTPTPTPEPIPPTELNVSWNT